MIFLINREDLNLNNAKSVVYFYSSWMPFHKRMYNMIKVIEENNPDIIFYGVDVDHFKEIVKIYEVTSIPVLIFFKDGFEKKRINGIPLISAVKNIINVIYNKEVRDEKKD